MCDRPVQGLCSYAYTLVCFSQRASHPCPPDFHMVYGGISEDHPRRKFRRISLRKFRRCKVEFSMWIFRPLFPRESLKIFPHGYFSHISLKMSKCHKRPYKGSQLQKISQWCLHVKSFVNLKAYRFGEISLSFLPETFSRNLVEVSVWEFPNDLSTAYNKWSMSIKPPFYHPANYIGDSRNGNTETRNCGAVEPRNSGVDRIYRENVFLWAGHALCTLVCQFIVTCPMIG